MTPKKRRELGLLVFLTGLGVQGALAVGKRVTLKHPSYGTPLDPTSRTRHVSVVQVAGDVLYNETL